jgi:hypothetical protein
MRNPIFAVDAEALGGNGGELENGRLADWPVKGCIIYRRVFLFRRGIYGFRLGMKVWLEIVLY